MEILQTTIAILLGVGSLVFLVNKLTPNNNPATDQSCGKGCGCKTKDTDPNIQC